MARQPQHAAAVGAALAYPSLIEIFNQPHLQSDERAAQAQHVDPRSPLQRRQHIHLRRKRRAYTSGSRNDSPSVPDGISNRIHLLQIGSQRIAY